MKSTFKTEIGLRIKEIRKGKGITQERLAEVLDITPQFISLIESGSKRPSLETIIKISHALKVNPGDLFYKSGPEKSTHLKKSGSRLKSIISFLETLNEKELQRVHGLLRLTFKK